MLFNSFEFAIFLPVVFIIYWFLLKDKLRMQNLFLVIASYLFYGWWDWRFLSLIIISSFVDYYLGILLSKNVEQSKRKSLLLISIIINLGFLGFFKYYNFFVDSFIDAFSLFGVTLEARSLNIILPVGISFYTFQTLSYTIDVYRRKIEPTTDIISFFAFVSFFPQLVAGPIERASNLLPQFNQKRTFSNKDARDGARQILWGFFKKMVIADNAATIVNRIFENYDYMPTFNLWLGAVFFAFQIYGDFSGYSDIAIGTSRLFGFNLMKNFNFPYFSKDFSEFWRRWHISLSTWLRDYLFLPVSYSVMRFYNKDRVAGIKTEVLAYAVGILFTWFLGGLWHGAKWTFIVWGCLHGFYLVFSHLTRKIRKRTLKFIGIKKTNPILIFVQTIFVFILTVIAWVFFRAENLNEAFNYLSLMFSSDMFHIPMLPPKYKLNILILFIFIITEWLQRNKDHVLQIENYPLIYRWGIYLSVFFLIVFLGNFNKVEFIYFQF